MTKDILNEFEQKLWDNNEQEILQTFQIGSTSDSNEMFCDGYLKF